MGTAYEHGEPLEVEESPPCSDDAERKTHNQGYWQGYRQGFFAASQRIPFTGHYYPLPALNQEPYYGFPGAYSAEYPYGSGLTPIPYGIPVDIPLGPFPGIYQYAYYQGSSPYTQPIQTPVIGEYIAPGSYYYGGSPFGMAQLPPPVMLPYGRYQRLPSNAVNISPYRFSC